MNKTLIITVAIILALIAGFAIMLAPPSAATAILYIESGTVEVDQGKGWQSATNEMKLNVGDSIKTGNGEATLILLEGEVMQLEPNTEITLDLVSKKKISLTQKSGETWNKVTKISGVREYQVTTPTTVATVRGTEFLLGMGDMEVAEGNVEFERMSDKKKMMVGALNKATADTMTMEKMDSADMAKMDKYKARTLKRLERVREMELNKHRLFLRFSEKMGYNEQKIKEILNDIDEGRKKIDEYFQKIPGVLKPRANRTYELTKEIQKLKDEIRSNK
jgi:hypothetical protein